MKSSNKNQWADHYTRKAKQDGFPARSVYKLQEIQKKYRLIKKGDKVLDLGCAPGSWLMYAASIAGEKGNVIGIDLEPVSTKLPSQATSYVHNILNINQDLLQNIGNGFNIVLSDMAPSTTGNKFADNAKSFNLSKAALDIAVLLLAPGGSFVCKIFQGAEFKEFSDYVSKSFHKNKIFKPKSSRKASKEIFIIGLNKR